MGKVYLPVCYRRSLKVARSYLLVTFNTPIFALRLPTFFLPPGPQLSTVYTQVESELVSIRAEWTQAVAARELK